MLTRASIQRKKGKLCCQVSWLPERPAVLVTSTSWTDDEDIGMVLKCMQLWETAAERTRLCKLVLFVTGKGPGRAAFEKALTLLEFKHVQIHTIWLSIEDYPKLLGLADVGICLHTSSSKLDLPMKVVDMFGCGLPVCAIEYAW